MNPEEKFEQILDEAIVLFQKGKSVAEIVAVFPEYTKELQELLGVAHALSEIKTVHEQERSFKSILAKLPTLAPPPKQHGATKQENFWTRFTQWCARPRVMAGASIAMLVVLVTYAGANFVLNQLVIATTEPNPPTFTVSEPLYLGSHEAQVPASNPQPTSGSAGRLQASDLLEPQVSEESGLAASDSSVSVQRILNAASGLTKQGVVSRVINSGAEIITESAPDKSYEIKSTKSIKDTREFLKTDYELRLRTRRVQELSTRIKTIIRGYGGRIDNASAQKKFARISFVVPQKDYEAFKEEVKSLVPARFVEEQERATNLLPQKQEIEIDLSYASSTRADLEKKRTDLIAKHKNTVASLNRQITAINGRISTLSVQFNAETDEEIRKNLQSQINTLYAERSGVQRKLRNENETYEDELAYLDDDISVAVYNIDKAKEKDANLLDTVATVEGSIIIDHISAIAMFGYYVVDFWYLIIIGSLIIVGYRFYRKRRVEDIEPL